ncbi:hypothetical protein FIBSPDRAFT_873963 [Athelia psychrophila]|uniref:Uncharacterized protein n=1 Tax=Athelia psychrophila TaxID=1759441 RepID=A0A165XXV4_9AGAM|nr:hypothetical protein FIBSPDRAFT_873963 [Fibularhizoctonia sp. CBS 109695]
MAIIHHPDITSPIDVAGRPRPSTSMNLKIISSLDLHNAAESIGQTVIVISDHQSPQLIRQPSAVPSVPTRTRHLRSGYLYMPTHSPLRTLNLAFTVVQIQLRICHAPLRRA